MFPHGYTLDGALRGEKMENKKIMVVTYNVELRAILRGIIEGRSEDSKKLLRDIMNDSDREIRMEG